MLGYRKAWIVDGREKQEEEQELLELLCVKLVE